MRRIVVLIVVAIIAFGVGITIGVVARPAPAGPQNVPHMDNASVDRAGSPGLRSRSGSAQR
jgi:hypothetical protein